MEEIVVIGAGGLAREIKFLIAEINRVKPKYNFLGYIVSDLTKLTDMDSKSEILGDYNWFKKKSTPVNAAIGIGSPKSRLKVSNEISSTFKNVAFPALIHPSVTYDETSCSFMEGAIVCAANVLTVNIRIESFALINLDCTIGHEASIGSGSVLNPSVNISGGVKIEEGVLVGTGAQVLQYLSIGKDAVVGSAACVTKNVAPNRTVVGIPAKPLKKMK